MANRQKDKKYDPHLDTDRVGPIGVARYSIEYFAAAEATDAAIGCRSQYSATAPSPVMFLMGRSLELGFKAFLIQKNVPLNDIKNSIGHNLIKALDKAGNEGLYDKVDVSENDRAIITILNATYSKKHLEYFVRGATTYPVYGPLQSVCKKILVAVINDIPQAHHLLRSPAGQIFASIII